MTEDFSCPEHGKQAVAALVPGYTKYFLCFTFLKMDEDGSYPAWVEGDFVITEGPIEVICDICGEKLGEAKEIEL